MVHSKRLVKNTVPSVKFGQFCFCSVLQCVGFDRKTFTMPVDAKRLLACDPFKMAYYKQLNHIF